MEKVNRLGEEKINKIGSEMKITRYNGNKDIDVYFPEYEYIATNKNYNDFKNGRIKCPYEPRTYGIGYIGEGKYSFSESGELTNCYKTWKSMLMRCYCKNYLSKNTAYEDIYVCNEWHNFQNFAQWYEENYYEVPGEKMCLDKDILSTESKIYSPDNCIFVPEKINLLFINSNKSKGYQIVNGKYKAKCNIDKIKKYLGSYDTPEEAFQAYKHFKENYVKQIADEYKDLIPEKLYNAMYEYEVKVED